ncbi:MAG: multiple sugar transport system permease protein [Chloroflexota bacterium]|jgi:multiple sugar transport system permease protein|nr:multiple sugar transport system permease protein [Chloroflexota bacterium]
MTATTQPIRAETAATIAPVGDRGARLRRRLAYIAMITYAVLMFVPFAWSIITSFKTLPDSVRLSILPNPFTFQGWEFAWNNLNPSLPVLFLNSAIFAGAVTLTNLALGSLAGYAFARLKFPGRELLFVVVLATLMIPDQLRLVPIYVGFNNIGLTTGIAQYIGVILVLAISATSVFLLRQYFLSIPHELEEAARLDGAGFFTTFWRVMLPLATPALSAVAILQFQGTWNSFFWPLIIARDQGHWPLSLGLVQFRLAGGFSNNWPPLMATIVLATIPILILYIFFQRYFVEGVAAAAVKG